MVQLINGKKVSFLIASIFIISIVFTFLLPFSQLSSEASGARANQPPQAIITSPTNGGTYANNAAILFDGSNSIDPDGDPLTYSWMLMNLNAQPGPGMFPIIRSTDFFFETLDVGSWMVSLDVNDSIDSGSDLITITVVVNNPPTAAISSPGDGDEYTTDDSITFDASPSSDPDGNELYFYWESSVDGPLSLDKSFSTKLSPGRHHINLTVWDVYESLAEAGLVIDVRIPNYVPSIELMDPPMGNANAEDELLIRWNATDENENETLYVDLFYNDVLDISSNKEIATNLMNTGEYLWDISELENGKYYVYGLVSDDEGADSGTWSPGYLEIERNLPPSEINGFNISDLHDLTPVLTWYPVEDPNGDDVVYSINIGTHLGGKDIVDGFNTSDPRYEFTTELEYLEEYHVQLWASDPAGLTSEIYQDSFELFNQAPTEPNIVIEPSKPTTLTDLTCNFIDVPDDPDGDELDYTFKWFYSSEGSNVENDPGITENSVSSSELTVGDRWWCRLMVSDGFAQSMAVSPKVSIANLEPEAIISSPSTQEDVYTSSDPMIVFSANGSSDEDGDRLSYRWESDVQGNLGSEKYFLHKLYPGVHQITLTISDGHDSDSDMVVVFIRDGEILVEGINLKPSEPVIGEEMTISASLNNIGGELHDVAVKIMVGDKIIGEQSVDQFEHSSFLETKKFKWTPLSVGKYTVEVIVNGISTKSTFEVTFSTPDTIVDPYDDVESSSDGDSKFYSSVKDNYMIFIIIIILLLLLLFMVILINRERRNRTEKSEFEEPDHLGGSGMHEVPFPPMAFPQLPWPPYPGANMPYPLLPEFNPALRHQMFPPEAGMISPFIPASLGIMPDPSLALARDSPYADVEEELKAEASDDDAEEEHEKVFDMDEPKVECYKCGGEIVVTSDRRPLIVVCPNCGTEGELE